MCQSEFACPLARASNITSLLMLFGTHVPPIIVGKAAVILSKANHKPRRKYDRHFCKEHHLIETFFAKLRQFRAIATRYGKTTRNFLAAVYLTASAILAQLTTRPSQSGQFGAVWRKRKGLPSMDGPQVCSRLRDSARSWVSAGKGPGKCIAATTGK
jgi:hypothetical protein